MTNTQGTLRHRQQLHCMEVPKEMHGAMQIKVNVKPAAEASSAPTEDITG
jgi:hypothetical protein